LYIYCSFYESDIAVQFLDTLFQPLFLRVFIGQPVTEELHGKTLHLVGPRVVSISSPGIVQGN